MIAIPNAPTWMSVGWIIALITLIVIIVLIVINGIDTKIGLLIGAVALARLL